MHDPLLSPTLKEHYDGYYKGRWQWRRLGAVDSVKTIMGLCANTPHDTIIDIGAGEGAIVQELCERNFGKKLHALEISRSGVEAMQALNIATLVECRLFDGYRTPYDDNHFDLALLIHVVEHAEYPRMLLREASRISRSLLVICPMEHTLRLSRDFVFRKTGHINFYTPKTFRRLMQTTGLEVVKQVVNNPSFDLYRYQFGWKAPLRWLPRELLLRLWPSLAASIFTYHSAVLCRKIASSAGGGGKE